MKIKKIIDEEGDTKNRDGQVIKNWRTMPATMIRKVALIKVLKDGKYVYKRKETGGDTGHPR